MRSQTWIPPRRHQGSWLHVWLVVSFSRASVFGRRFFVNLGYLGAVSRYKGDR